jgi:hypothetical protein
MPNNITQHDKKQLNIDNMFLLSAILEYFGTIEHHEPCDYHISKVYVKVSIP